MDDAGLLVVSEVLTLVRHLSRVAALLHCERLSLWRVRIVRRAVRNNGGGVHVNQRDLDEVLVARSRFSRHEIHLGGILLRRVEDVV